MQYTVTHCITVGAMEGYGGLRRATEGYGGGGERTAAGYVRHSPQWLVETLLSISHTTLAKTGIIVILHNPKCIPWTVLHWGYGGGGEQSAAGSL